MDLLGDLRKVYRNEGKITEISMSRDNRNAIDHYALMDQSLVLNLINAIEKQPNPQMKQ
ncbi:hypothetical protein [Acetilactobacillus jinshanensis]|uniref:hypothetical protein n=1 Tax=Acetilactobacillus jinshanensis TaxID=1720083 RepID=UPI0013A61EFA|nr:hypothetical protein [Acetilactobacillus jinshanensis]URL61341.1 hypothetical protein HGK75_04940 [uncultured bacterium]